MRKKIIWLTKEEEDELSDRCQKALCRLRKRLGAAIDAKALPETVMSAARARRPIPPEIADIESARDELVEKCTPWARNIVRCTYERNNRGVGTMDLDDLTQCAMLGLMRAALRFKSRRAKWTTYCTWWICQATGRALRQEQYMIRIPEACQAQLRQGQLHESEADRVRKIMAVSLKVIPEYIPNPEHIATPDQAILYEAMWKLLDEREFEVVLRRFGMCGYSCQTLKTIGEELELSRERIRQIQNKALSKLRESKLREELECQ